AARTSTSSRSGKSNGSGTTSGSCSRSSKPATASFGWPRSSRCKPIMPALPECAKRSTRRSSANSRKPPHPASRRRLQNDPAAVGLKLELTSNALRAETSTELRRSSRLMRYRVAPTRSAPAGARAGPSAAHGRRRSRGGEKLDVGIERSLVAALDDQHVPAVANDARRLFAAGVLHVEQALVCRNELDRIVLGIPRAAQQQHQVA